MGSETPSAWAMEQARAAVSVGTCNCVSPGRDPCFVHTAIARALDAAREQGRCEREAEIVAYLRAWRVRKKGEPDSACLHVERNADEIERGAGRKEDK